MEAMCTLAIDMHRLTKDVRSVSEGQRTILERLRSVLEAMRPKSAQEKPFALAHSEYAAHFRSPCARLPSLRTIHRPQPKSS